jgi:hypothetical protein
MGKAVAVHIGEYPSDKSAVDDNALENNLPDKK